MALSILIRFITFPFFTTTLLLSDWFPKPRYITELYRFLLSYSMLASIGRALAFLATLAIPFGRPYEEVLLKL